MDKNLTDDLSASTDTFTTVNEISQHPASCKPNFDTVMKHITFLSVPSAFVFALKYWSRYNSVRSNPEILTMTGPSPQVLSPGRIEPRGRDAPL